MDTNASLTSEFLQAALTAPPDRREQALRILLGQSPAQPNATEGPLLFSIVSAAKHAGVSRSTLIRCIKAGKIKPVHVLPGLPKIRKCDIERLAGVAE